MQIADDTGMGSHLEASLQHDIDLIRTQVREMAAQCERAIREAMEALLSGHRQPAYLVILRDQQIDESEQQLDRLCLEFLIRQQPAAGHLRFGYAAIKMSSELERIGDHAEAIARRLLKFESARPSISYAPFDAMANITIAMLRDAVRAFDQKDERLARSTMLVEETIDRMRGELDTTLASMQEDRALTIEGFAILSAISRRIERISDEARDMCFETIYMCTGDFVKHRAPEVFRVLFVDRHNHCRSQMAEAIATNLSLPHMLFTSAGLDPRSIDPRLPPFLAEKGLDVSHHRPKSIDQVPNLSHYHVVIAFDQSAYYSVRFHRTLIVCIDWSVADPSTVEGTAAEVHTAYEHTFTFIRDHLQELVEAISKQDR
jgi:phosphate transport system protein